MEATLDLDLLLTERGESHGGGGEVDGGDPGDRLLASLGRICGPAALDVVLYNLRQAAVDCGWDPAGSPPWAVPRDPENEEGVAGREKAMINATADALVEFSPGASCESMSSRGYGCPAAALEFSVAGDRGVGTKNGTRVTIRYLASGANADAQREMETCLRAASYSMAD
jgi:hypothetical protein